MDKSLKVGEDEWRERERGSMKLMPQMKYELSSLISQMIKVEKMHIQGLFL